MAQRASSRVSVIFPEQHPQAAVALGRSFINDPAIGAIVTDVKEPVARAQRLAQLFSVLLHINRRHGQPLLGVVDNNVVVAAAVIEGALASSITDAVVTGLRQAPQMVKAAGWAGTMRAIRLGDTLFRNRPTKPHIYLNLLGVDPDHQRRHYGIALLDYLRDLASQRSELAGVYLETATEANVAYYTRAGYEVLGEIFPLGVRMWRMMQPRAKAPIATDG